MSHENKRRPQSIPEECMTENAAQLDPFEWHHLNNSKFALDDMRVMVIFFIICSSNGLPYDRRHATIRNTF